MAYGCTKTVSMVISHTYENLTLKARCCDVLKENDEFNFRSSCRVFFKVLSSRSFLKVSGCGSRNPIWRTIRHIVRTFLPPQQDLSKRGSSSERF